MSELTSLLFLQGCLIVPEGSREKKASGWQSSYSKDHGLNNIVKGNFRRQKAYNVLYCLHSLQFASLPRHDWNCLYDFNFPGSLA